MFKCVSVIVPFHVVTRCLFIVMLCHGAIFHMAYYKCSHWGPILRLVINLWCTYCNLVITKSSLNYAIVEFVADLFSSSWLCCLESYQASYMYGRQLCSWDVAQVNCLVVTAFISGLRRKVSTCVHSLRILMPDFGDHLLKSSGKSDRSCTDRWQTQSAVFEYIVTIFLLM